MITDIGFSFIRDWMKGDTIITPSGMLMGLGSTEPTFQDIKLGSPVDVTRHAFSSKSGVGTTAIFEYIMRSGDFILGSDFREIGMIQQSGGNVWFRETTYAITMFGSTEVTVLLNIGVV